MTESQRKEIEGAAKEHEEHVYRMEPYGVDPCLQKAFVYGAEAAFEIAERDWLNQLPEESFVDDSLALAEKLKTENFPGVSIAVIRSIVFQARKGVRADGIRAVIEKMRGEEAKTFQRNFPNLAILNSDWADWLEEQFKEELGGA